MPRKIITCIVSAMLCGVVASSRASVPDFSDFFDAGYIDNQQLNGNNGWQADSPSAVLIKSSGGYNSTYGVALGPDINLSNSFPNAGETNIWTDFFVKPAFYVPTGLSPVRPSFDTNCTAMFFVNSNGYIVIADVQSPSSTNWVTVGTSAFNTVVSPLTQGEWTRFSVFHRYGQTEWSLFLNGMLMHIGYTNINHSLTDYRAFRIYNGGTVTAYLDSVSIVTSAPPADLSDDYNGNDMRDAWELHFFGNLNGAHPATEDTDGDGYINAEESAANSNPWDPLKIPTWIGLPYYERFDTRANGTINGRNGWTVRGEDFRIAVTEIASYNGSGKSLDVQPGGQGELTNFWNTLTYTNVWIEFVSLWGFSCWDSSPNNNPTTAASSFFVDNSGYPKAQIGGSTVTLNQYLNGLTTNTFDPINMVSPPWVRFVAHVDYVQQRWTLWMSTNDYLAMPIATNMPFSQSITHFQGLFVSNTPSLAGFIDELSIVLTGTPTTVDSDCDGISDIYQRNYELTTAPPNRDSDNDGFSDEQEYICGTVPTNNNSFLRIKTLDVVTAGSPNVRIVFDTALDSDIYVLGTANPYGAKSSIGIVKTGRNGETNWYDHANGATNKWFFYQIASRRLGRAVTNVTEYAQHMENFSQPNKYYFVSVPMQGMDDLGTDLGEYLATGLAGGAAGVGDSIFLIDGISGNTNRFDLRTDKKWYTYPGGDLVTSQSVPLGTGIRVYRRGLTPTSTRANFFGLRYTNAVTSTISIPSGWSFRGWTYDRTMTYPSGTNYWGFPIPVGGTTTNNSDYIWVVKSDGSMANIRINSDGRWFYYGGIGGAGEANGLELSGGFWYYNHTGSSIPWNPKRP